MKIKYTFLTVSLLTLAALTQAQIKKGSVLVGGSIQYKNNKTENVNNSGKLKSKTFEIGPAAGFAIQDNLVIGLDLQYSNSKNNDYEINGYAGYAFLRKYWNINSKFYAFAHASGGYGRIKGESIDVPGSTYDSESKGWSVSASLIPGIAYSAGSKVMLEATFLPLFNIFYNKTDIDTRYDINNPTKSELKGFSVSSSLANAQQFSLGVRFLL